LSRSNYLKGQAITDPKLGELLALLAGAIRRKAAALTLEDSLTLRYRYRTFDGSIAISDG
jgi:hypothetical protein